jgi:hypothetical protein
MLTNTIVTMPKWQDLMCGRVGRVHKCNVFFCNKEGNNDTNNVDKQKEKGSMRIGCKGHVKVKLDPKEGRWFFDAINLNHNHQLHPEKRMTHFMRSHKSMEDGVKNLMEVMT